MSWTQEWIIEVVGFRLGREENGGAVIQVIRSNGASGNLLMTRDFARAFAQALTAFVETLDEPETMQ